MKKPNNNISEQQQSKTFHQVTLIILLIWFLYKAGYAIGKAMYYLTH